MKLVIDSGLVGSTDFSFTLLYAKKRGTSVSERETPDAAGIVAVAFEGSCDTDTPAGFRVQSSSVEG